MNNSLKFFAIGIIVILVITFGLFCGCKREDQEEEKYGSFYSIQTAFDRGWLSKNDIATIAQKHNARKSDDLTTEESAKLMKAYVIQYPRSGVGYEHVEIKEFLGKYNDGYAVLLHYDDDNALTEASFEIVAGATIAYPDSFRLSFYHR